jgi:TonB family protein
MSTKAFILLLGAALAGPAAAQHRPPDWYSPSAEQYLRVLQQSVAANLQLPQRALRSPQDGTAVVDVEIARDGTILGTSLEQKSGSSSVDSEALAVFARMQRLPPMPEGLYPGTDKATFSVPIIYQSD